jgi:hypothetical protein
VFLSGRYRVESIVSSRTLSRSGGRVSRHRCALHSFNRNAHYLRMAQHYSSLAEAEELGMLASGRWPLRQFRPNGWLVAHAAYR